MGLISEVGRRKTQVRMGLILISAFLWIGIALHLFPVWWMVTSSLKPYYEVYQFPPSLLPRHLTLASYKLFFTRALGTIPGSGALITSYPFWWFAKNSIIYTVAIMMLQIPGTALVGYFLAKLQNPKWGRLFFLFFIGTLLIPFHIRLIPSYLLIFHFPFPTGVVPRIPFTDLKFPSINFINTYWAVILPAAYSPFFVLLFKGFFDGIPDSIIDAARLDGASEMSIFLRVVLPISKTVFAVVAYFSFSAAWNSFMWPLIVINKEELYPLPLQLYRLSQIIGALPSGVGGTATESMGVELRRILEEGMGFNGLMALAIIESMPVFIMFIVFREYLMKGIKLTFK